MHAHSKLQRVHPKCEASFMHAHCDFCSTLCSCLPHMWCIEQGGPCEVGWCGICHNLWCCDSCDDSLVLPPAKDLPRAGRRQLPVPSHLIHYLIGAFIVMYSALQNITLIVSWLGLRTVFYVNCSYLHYRGYPTRFPILAWFSDLPH